MQESRIKELLNELRCGAVLITNPEDMLYYSAFTGEGAVVISEGKRLVVTDGRYTEVAQKNCKGFDVISVSGLYSALREIKTPVAVQADGISCSEYLKLKKEGIDVRPVSGVFDMLRSVKDEYELKCLKEAAKIAEKAFLKTLKFIKIGKTEKEAAAFIDYQMKTLGADKISFDTICVSGANGSLPHGVPSDKKFCSGEFVTLDFGCVYKGYCSDMTRTVALGSVADEMANVYDVVLAAQQKATDVIKEGVKCKEVDKAARSIIEANGYGENFVHSTGHGVGIKIHERPVLSPKSDETLKSGNVVTVEPGIYIAGKFGVRIENTLIVREDFGENLQKSSKELIIL